jgi:hypothetical protein
MIITPVSLYSNFNKNISHCIDAKLSSCALCTMMRFYNPARLLFSMSNAMQKIYMFYETEDQYHVYVRRVHFE